MPPKASPSKKTINWSSRDERKASIVSNASTKRPSRSEKKFSIISNASTKRGTLDDRKSLESIKMDLERKTLKKGEKTHEKRKTMTRAKPQDLKHMKSAAEVRLEEAIAEIVLARSSSSASVTEEEELSDKGSMDTKEFQLIDYPSKFISVDIESEETSSEEPEYLAQGQLESEEDFFEAFGYVPEMDELSEDVSVKDEKKEDIVEVPLETHGDAGKFVDPLTGQIDTDASSMRSEEPAKRVEMEVQEQSRAQLQSQSREQLQAQETESSTEEERSSYRSTSSSDLWDAEKKSKSADELKDSKSDMATTAQDDDQETYLQFLAFQDNIQKAETEQLEVDVEDILKEQQRLLNLEQTEDFLNNLIDLCVQKAEYIDEDIMLRRNLDKAKIIQMLKEKFKELYAERKKMEFLNRKCAHYYCRKNSVRQIAEDDMPAERKRTYSKVLHRLDELLLKERQTKAMCSAQKIKGQEEYKVANESNQDEIQKLEQLIKTTLRNDKFDKLTACVKRQVEKMSTIRKEISAARLKLFLEQHVFSELSMQLNKLEDLGNGLSLTDYDSLATETKALGKKLEERNNILKKLHHHYDASIHSMAHLKEKKSVMKYVVKIQNDVLANLQDEKIELRQSITEMKRKRNRARREIQKLSFQSGLLDKPNLMLDYDRTVKMANELKMLNGTMKQRIERLTHKIALLEERCVTRNSQQK